VDGTTNNRVDKINPLLAQRAKTPAVSSHLDTILIFFPRRCRLESASFCHQNSAHFRSELLPVPHGCRFQNHCRLAPIVASSEPAVLRSSLSPCDERRFRLTVPPPHLRCDPGLAPRTTPRPRLRLTSSCMRLSSHGCRPFPFLKLSIGLRVRASLSTDSYLNPTAGLKRRLPSI
jgi:hypothetical protein